MRRRIILIVLVFTVLIGAVGGVLLYLRHQSAPKQMARAQVAMRAAQYQRAADLAAGYIAKRPDDSQGYLLQAQAYARLGRFDDARGSLARAGELGADGTTVAVMVADTYTMQANRILSTVSPGASLQPDEGATAIKLLETANAELSRIQTTDEKRAVAAMGTTGLNLARIAGTKQALAARLREEAETAALAGAASLRDAKTQEAEQLAGESEATFKAAINRLLEAVKRNASRADTAGTLVELCVRQDDQTSLASAREIILGQEKPPASAAVRLVIDDLAKAEDKLDRAARQKVIEEIRQRLDKLLEQDPNSVEAQLARAQLAMATEDWETAEDLTAKVLKNDPRQFGARLIKGRLLWTQKRYREAEQLLGELKTDLPRWPSAHYWYAMAAEGAGYGELAREAMRKVTELDPENAGAHAYMADHLLKQGFPDKAFTDAKVCYDAQPGDSRALALYVEAASRSGRAEMAREALEKAANQENPSAPMLMAIAVGWARLGDDQKQVEAIRKAAESNPTTLDGRLAVAKALRLNRRTSEAEEMLRNAIEENPTSARAYLERGALFLATGRSMQAVEEFRKAVACDSSNVLARLALAKALYDSGLLNECETECNEIMSRDAKNSEAMLMVNQIKIIQGRGVSPEEALQKASGSEQGGLPLATAYLGSGRAQDCAEICEKVLAEASGNLKARVLLGQAYWVLGRHDECIQEWLKVLEATPDQLLAYIRVAFAVHQTSGREEAQAKLARAPGARLELVDMAMGWLFANRLRDFDSAAEAYGRVLTKPGAANDLRDRARLKRAQALALAGEPDRAILELDELSKSAPSRRQARYAKAQVLAAAGRKPESMTVLAALQKTGVEDRDDALLASIAQLYARINEPDKALAVCDEVQKLLPNDAKGYLLRARILQSAGRQAETIEPYRKAVELQPDNLTACRMLARTLDAQDEPVAAIEALRSLETAGETAHAVGLFELGALYARWGLPVRATEALEKLASMGYANDHRVLLALGQAFARLAEPAKARQHLSAIPEYSREYVAAQHLLVELAETAEEKRAILHRLNEKRPGQAGVATQEMNVLMSEGRDDEAAAAFQAFAKDHFVDRPPPNPMAFRALEAMLRAGAMKDAMALTADMARRTREPRWAELAALLQGEQAPQEAARLLPGATEAGLLDALLGFWLEARQGGKGAAWTDRLSTIEKRMMDMPTPRRIPAHYRILVALGCGRMADAEKEVAQLRQVNPTQHQALVELVSHVAAKGPREAVSLLGVALAGDLALPTLARRRALALLEARPAAQFAAELAASTTGDPKVYEHVSGVLEPKDCLVAVRIKGVVLASKGDFEGAARVFGDAVKRDPSNPQLLLGLGGAMEKLGRLDKALAAYRKAWEDAKDPAAANNAAYMVTLLHPDGKDELAEAERWAAAAADAAPAVPEFRDTKGWIAYLQGRPDEAVRDLRRAIKRLPNVPDVHCHLGLAELAAGNSELARWHLEAAVTLGEIRLKEKDDPAVAKTVNQARQALAKMEQPES